MQERCNNEREVQNQEGTESTPNDERGKGTRDLDIKHSTVPREQMAEKNSHVRKHKYSNYYSLIDRYNSLNEDDFAYDYYSSDEKDDERKVDESSKCCNCCKIL